MTERQLEAYRLMLKALGKAYDEITNPGISAKMGFDILGHIEQVVKLANQVGPEEL